MAAVDRIRPRINRLFRRCGIPPQEAEDILQEVFLATLAAMRRYGDGWEITNLEGWLYNTTKYRGVLHARRRRLQEKLFSSIEELAGIEQWYSEGPMNPDRVVSALDAVRGIAQLRTKEVRLVEMRVLGYSSAEIAKSTGYSEGSIRKIWRRSLAKLRRELRQGRNPKIKTRDSTGS